MYIRIERQGQQAGKGNRGNGVHTLDVPELFKRVGGIGDELSKEYLEHMGRKKAMIMML